MKRRIKQNVYGNWRGYEGQRKVMDFGTDETGAKEWLAGDLQPGDQVEVTFTGTIVNVSMPVGGVTVRPDNSDKEIFVSTSRVAKKIKRFRHEIRISRTLEEAERGGTVIATKWFRASFTRTSFYWFATVAESRGFKHPVSDTTLAAMHYANDAGQTLTLH